MFCQRVMTFFTALAFLCCFTATTEAKESEPVELAADAGIVLPVGDWGDRLAGVGLGAGLRFEQEIIPQLWGSVRALFVYHTENEGWTWMEIPVLAGASYYFAENSMGGYVSGEVGLVYHHAKWDDLVGSVIDDSISELRLGMGLGGGYRMGAFDFRAELYFPWLDGDFSDYMAIMGTVGYTLTAF